MLHLIPFLNRLTWRVLLVIVFISGVLVYATSIDRTEYTTEQLIIVPGTATSDTWKGLESVLIQDLSGDSLYQDFNETNSAFYKAEITEEENISTPVSDGISSDNNSEQTNTSDSNFSTTSLDSLNNDESSLNDESINNSETQSDEPSNNSNEEVVVPEPVVNDGVPVSFGKTPSLAVISTTDLYPWAQSDVTDIIEETGTEGDREEQDTQITTSEESQTISDLVVLEEETASEFSTTSTDFESFEEIVEESDTASTTIPEEISIDLCAGIIDCKIASVEFSNFMLPDFSSGTVLDTVQLRLSLAAKTKNDNNLQKFLISYSFDNANWSEATVIDINDEISNSINGDYFLAALDVPTKGNDLSSLSVKVTYVGASKDLEAAYIDAVWLDVSSGKFYEPDDIATSTDAIEYERDLLLPEINTLMGADLDVVLGQVPEFNFEYQSQQNFFKRVFSTLFGETTFSVEGVTVSHSVYGYIDTPFNIEYIDDSHWSLKLPNAPQKMRPGKYEVVVKIAENDQTYTDTFEFYWGVLAINTTKSMYFKDESVTFNLAALTDKGDTICNADLHLKVIDPNFAITEVPVDQSGSCGANNVTDIPDYLATFLDTKLTGRYIVQLEHRNTDGEVVHRIEDAFEVRDYIPFEIERSAPTRIYPPAPYQVSLKIKANRSFVGDIVERVPRGFVFADIEGAEVTTLEEATLLTWKNVTMSEGETRTFTYVFDAPDISPYLYLLGPLSLDGFEELRAWQIASDAISSVAWLTSTRSQLGTNLNDPTPGALVWSTSTIDAFYFSHSTSTTPERLVVTKDGDYLVSVTLPLERTDTVNNQWARVGFEVRVNGVAVPHGVGRSGLIYNVNSGSRQNESSSHGNFLLTDLNANDYIEVYAQALTSYTSQPIFITGRASMYVEHVAPSVGVFAATATRTVASSSFNTTASEVQWTETRQDTGFLHSDTVNSEDITITDPGTYMVFVNMPLQSQGSANPYRNILGRVLLDGTQVSGGVFSQGTIIVTANADNLSSIHWSGVVVATTTNQLLSISLEQEAAVGTTTVPAGFTGSIYIQKLPTQDIIALRGRDLTGGTDWNVTPAQSVLWDTQLAYDTAVFTHSTTTNSHQITVDQGGDYLLSYNDALVIAGATNNVIINVLVNGVNVSGAQTKTHYTSNSGGQQDSSGSLVYNLEGLSPGDIVSVTTLRDANNTVANDRSDAMLMLWKKKAFNFRPGASTMYNTPFDNVRFSSTTPYFDFSTTDPDGSSSLVYQFAISTTSDFASSTTKTSDVDSGFTNAVTPADTSPFNENERIRFQLQGADTLTNGTYYWRVRAKDITGSDEFGDWSTTQSLTVDTTVSVASWFQTTDSQFLSNVLTGVASADGGGAVVDIAENTEALLVYGEKTDTLLKYRFWNGSTWGSEINGPSVGAEIYWAESAAGVTRDEYVAVTLTADGDTNALVYNASSTTWGNQIELVNDVNTPARRGIAVAYETISGDAMVVTCSAGASPLFSIWNGTSWTATTSIAISSASNCNWLALASDPVSDEIILVIKGAADSYEAIVWDGTGWNDNKTLGRVAGTNLNTDGMNIEYEESGEQAIFVSTDAGDNEFMYTTWDGTIWSTNINFPLLNDFETGRLVRDVGTDQIGFCLVDAGSDIYAGIWDGDAWGTFSSLEPVTESIQSRPVDCAFETFAGRDGYFSVAYSDATTDEYQYYDGASWSGPLNLTDMEEFWYLRLLRTGDGTILAAGMENAGIDPLRASDFNGTSWSANTLIEADPAETGADPRSESFSMSARRFSYAEGVVRTHPVTFTSVSGQNTWGDVSFSTTEPVGTGVTLRLKYTASTTCDTYIPNGTLAGNGTGFTSTSSPINISGLSTSTYSQICLEAVIRRTGPTSASLDDWEVSWVRQPKLIQSSYRWYTNGSFYTPTDAWPLGVFNVAEDTPISATEAISINERIRLRIGAEGLNINLATNTASLKLQYAEGLTCSPTLSWQDVGAVGSTTAIWRGYENSIVGSDWYNGSFKRRLKITVDHNLVDADLTNFPVFVNLDDLPTTFFDYVQSDGDDIRITKSDGITEVPYELVSINTTTDKGELHFKGDLASTTNSEFYIYYDNPSASGYAVTATYGRNNVWTNNFEAVYHLDTNPASAITDSTGRGNTLTSSGGMGSGNSTTSILGNGIYFDGTDDRLTNGTFSWPNTNTAVTVTAWNNVATAEVQNSNLFGFTAAGSERFASHAPWSDNIIYWDYGTCCGSPGRVSTSYTTYRNKWTHVALTSQGGGGTFMGIYLDGALVNSLATADDPNVALTGFALGATSPAGGSHHRGRIDEFRIATTTRSLQWISTEENNQSNSTGFYAVSAEEVVSDGRPLPSVLLSDSDYPESYEEANPTRLNINTINVGNQAEWDFVLQNNGGTANTNYCFRLTYSSGATLASYVNYPRLITNAEPLRTENSAPFDNEQLASTSPWFEFAADDELDDLVSYEIEVSTDALFGSVLFTRDSNSQFSLFTNLSNPSERSVYEAGQTIRFVPDFTLSNNTTYWWRVRALDDNGSGAYGEWSIPTSFTVDTGTTITTWYQTTEEQFNTDELLDATVTASDDVRISGSFTVATTTSSAISYDDRDTGNAWGELLFTDDESSGDIRYSVEYLVSASEWQLVPDVDLAGNSTGFDTSGVSLLNLDTDLYHTLRIRAILTGNSSLPRLQSWSITWGLRIDPPVHNRPFDNAKVDTTTPTLQFITADPQNDALEYEIEIDTETTFTSPTSISSLSAPGFSNLVTPADTNPFNSNEEIAYVVQSPLTNGLTYWWRVRARDPAPGENSYSDWSEPQSFTVDTSIDVTTWYQTTGEQFSTNDLSDIETTAGAAQVTTIVNGAMVAYGESTSLTPKYRIWNGSEWSDSQSALSVGAFIEWSVVKASPLRNEYALATLGTDGDVNLQIYNANLGTWGNLFEMETEIANTNLRAIDLAYESVSGDLLAISCSGTEANYAIWNGTSWFATTSIALSNTNNCEYIKLASDPLSDEIIGIFRHGIASSTDYEALVWSGSSWNNSSTFGNMADSANEGMAVEYEASGDQAVVVVSDGANASFLYNTWNGTSWSGVLSNTIQDDFEHGMLKRDPASDRLALCNIDQDTQISNIFWNGAAWQARDLLEATGNSAAGRPVDCEFETKTGREGYLMIPYSDTADVRYQYYATSSYSGELPLGVFTDAWTTQTIRTADGLIFMLSLQDEGTAPADRYEFAFWDGLTWQGFETLSGVPSVSGTPFHESISMAAQIFPNFVQGTMRSTPIEFASGDGPRWQEISWSDNTPGSSLITYKVYYESAPGVYSLIPNSALSGNSTGFTTGPIDISSLDTTTYHTLQLEAYLQCVSGDCPELYDWQVKWSEGIIVSGMAYDYDGITALASGTVAIAVNGVLQSGKTGTISSGFTTQKSIVSAVGTTTFSVPAGVTQLTVKSWGAGGGGGAGGVATSGAPGGAGGYSEGTIAVTPAESLTVKVGGAGNGGVTGSAAGGGGGGGYSALYRSTTPLILAGGGGGGGAGHGGISYVGVGTGCAVNGAACTPTVPGSLAVNDVLIAVLHSRTNTAHTCTTNCFGWTEFSVQAGDANGRVSVWYYRATSTLPTNPTFAGPATDSYTGRIWAFRGVTPSGDPFDVRGTNTTQTAVSPFVGSGLTTTVANAMPIFVGGSMDDNTWGPGGGVCTVPNSASASFYSNNTAGNDNSIFLCYDGAPTASAGPFSVPTMVQATLGNDAGRHFTFALRPATTSVTSAGFGGAGGGISGIAGGASGSSNGGGAGTSIAGGAAGGGLATAGSSLNGGLGGGGTDGGAGGTGGINGGGAGGTGDATTAQAGGGGGGSGYFGGGGGSSAASSTVSGAGGGGGSSFFNASMTATSTIAGSGSTAPNSLDTDYVTGVADGGSGGATSTNGSNGGSGRVVLSWTATTTAGVWSISNINASPGDVITVFVNGATTSQRTVGVTKYDGVGDITDMELNVRHLTIGSSDNSTTTNIDIGLYDGNDDSDIFYTVDGSNQLLLCGIGVCNDARLKIKSGSTYQPLTNSTLINFQNYGVLSAGTSTIRVSSAWQQLGTFRPDTSTIILSATSGTPVFDEASTTIRFFNLTFGETSGSATWSTNKSLDVDGALNVNFGTLARGTSTISIGGNLSLGASGSITGISTTTFDGTGSNSWADAKSISSSTNVGYVVIDGTSKTVTLAGNVGAETVTIGADDTLNASGSGFNINVVRNWTNNNLFVPQTGTVTFMGTSSGVIARGTSNFNNLTFSGIGGNWSFSTSTLALNGTLTIATGTVTLPTGTTTIGGSFTNTGGVFAHNNGEVRMTSTVAGRTINVLGTPFLNSFYDLTFSGVGGWTMNDAATTTNKFTISAGAVTLPSSTLTVGGNFDVTGSGSFAHNNGELVLLVQAANTIRTNGSSLNNVRSRGGSASWYDFSWNNRKAITVNSSKVGDSVTNFPVYVNLAHLGSDFFSSVRADGSDIRVTTSNGVTEVPVEIVSINTGGQSGELHFRAPSLSTSTNSVFYIYYGNSSASGYASTTSFGSQNVWSNSYQAVYHLDTDPASTMMDSTSNNRHLTQVGGMGPGNSVAGVLGNAIDFDGLNDYLRNTTFAWPNASNTVTVTAWNNVTTAETKAANLFGFTESGGQRFATHGPWSDATLYWDFGAPGVPGRVSTSYSSYRNKWTHVGLTSPGAGGGNMSIYFDGSLITSSTASDPSATLTGFSLGSLGASQYHDGRIDEFRIASVVRSAGWISTERSNQASTTDFYTVSSLESRHSRTFIDTNTTVLGNVTFESGANVVFPTGILSIGGSFDNNASFDANSGTVRFNSSSGSETIAAGTSSFATLEFNSAGGDFTVIENATSTVATNLTNATQFTLQSGLILTSEGTFTNALSASSTTWTGSTLKFTGSDFAMNTKSHAGDSYGTIDTWNDADVSMWNSSATTYLTASTSSIYSQDHAGIDGDLNIYGNYVRTTGTEQWSFGTDFDGTVLGSGRQVDVKIATGSTVGLTNASLNLTGTTSATTTVSSISGTFALNATNTTITARNFSVTGTNALGFGLYSSTTLSSFDDGYFEVYPGFTGIRIDGTTVSTNPAKQLNRIMFATTTVGSASNVTFVGTSTSFVWFKVGGGNLYGEAFDSGDLNPGAIRFDDSSYLITVSGRVLIGDGSTAQGLPVCNGVAENVRLVVNNGSYVAQTPCNGTTGLYTFNNVAFVGDPKISVYLNTNGGVQGAVVTKTPTTDITNLDIYANQVILRHEGVSGLSIADLDQFNYASDTDMGFVATTTPSVALTVTPGRGLLVWASSTFTPGGPVTLSGNASSSPYEGSLTLATSSQFIAAGTDTHTLSGRLVVGSNATLTAASSTFNFVATTTGKSITSSATLNLHNVTFSGVSGAWNITAPLVLTGDMTVSTGTVTGTNNITLNNGQLTGDGTLSLGSGTTTIARTNIFGGTRPWSVFNLQLGSGSLVGTTTFASVATTTVGGLLTIANMHTLDAQNASIDLAGAGNVLSVLGTFRSGTSMIQYSGVNANVLGTTYYDLSVGALVGSSTFAVSGTGLTIGRNLRVGNGTASSTLTTAASDPVLTVNGGLTIASQSTFIASDIATTTLVGSYDNNGTFIANGGRVNFTGTGTHTIEAGNSSFYQIYISGTGNFTITEPATSTANFVLQNASNFTLATGTTLAVSGAFSNRTGGGATNWSGTLAAFGGGSLTLNSSTTNDFYTTLNVSSGTRVRMWNSSANTYNISGGLYSQDHANNNGLLNIYGTFTEDSANDYWSYDTDFDGTNLSGGSERSVSVQIASGSNLSWIGGSLNVIGTTTASTTVSNQGSGVYGLTIGGIATTSWNYVTVRDVNSSGVIFTGTPVVSNFSHTDHLVNINSAAAITLGSSVINANQARSFTGNVFASSSGVTGAINVTATGTALSSWRFTNHTGNISGESFDNDPAGDPGYVTWDDSAALISVSGIVYSDEGSTLSTICDGVTNNIRLVVANTITDTTYNTSCSVASSSFSISSVAYSPLDTLALYIVGETEEAANVSVAPISSISNMHLYENRIIVRHENTNPLTIADMAVWDSSDDAEIPYTAIDAVTDTLTIPANRKLLVWNNKTFAPGGDITVSGGGGGSAYDGTLEVLSGGTLRAVGLEHYTIGGSFVFGSGAVFTAGLSTTTFTTSGAGRTIDVNDASFNNVVFSGSGSWTITDSSFTANKSYNQSAGTVTFGSGTTTIGSSFNATGGSFVMAGSALVFTSTTTGNIVRFDDSNVPTVRFTGQGGSWSMTDTNATTTGDFVVSNTGTITLPAGTLGIGGSFNNASGTIAHNTADIYMNGNGTLTLRANNSDLFALRKVGGANLTIVDSAITFRDDLTIASGTIIMATTTTSIGGSLAITNGSLTHSSGTILFNATAVGKTINASTSSLYNVTFGSGSGGWDWLGTATVTNDLTISAASSFTKETGTTLNVGGVFTNLVGGGATIWTNTVLRLTNSSGYTLNTKASGGDSYATLDIPTADIRMWNSSVSTSTLGSLASVYSQDNNAVDGALYIYGDFTIATGTEHWSYATDFDGTVLSGPSQRAVTVSNFDRSTTTLSSGSLNIVGVSNATTTITNNATGTYSMLINGGTFNATYYRFNNLSSSGLTFTGTPSITTLDNGYYELALTGGSMISVSSTTLNANASKVFTTIGMATTSSVSSGFNINLNGTTSNAWRFANTYGVLSGESFDNDGVDACGSIRFDNSACLLTSQSDVRWRLDNGGEEAPSSEWFDSNWDYRQRVRIVNSTATAYSTTSVKIVVPYDSSMKSSFEDLRFTNSDGISPVNYWIEKYTASTEAVVWVKVPAIPASSVATVFMYYGNASASTTSSSSATMLFVDDFEDNNISEYSGDTSLFQTDTAPVYGGTYALEALNKSGRTTDGIYRTNGATSQGQTIRWMQYIDTTAGSGDEACTLFGVQNANNNYAICLEQFGVDRIVISKDVDDNDVSGTVLSSSTVTYSTGWYEVEVDWQTTNRISAYLYNSAGSLVSSTTVVDSSYTSGGVGFTFWFQNGSWDSYTTRELGPRKPAIYFGAKQTDGGAGWLASQNALGGAIPGDVRRLRIGIENTGLDITGQLFRLEYAAKGASPSCQAVSGGSYSAVPNQASCGSSPVCMQTSSNVTDGGVTTDLLSNMSGAFVSGKIVESPSATASSLDIDQNNYTELEYVITPTISASDSYCFRVTNAGTPLDYYENVAELGLQFDPTISSVTLNNGQPIILTPNATTTIYATTSVTDFNGYADLVAGTSTIYRSGVGPSCSTNNNNCYISTTTSSCSFVNCSGNTCELRCMADVYFHADPTDASTYEGEEWLAYLEVRDSGGGYDFGSAPGVELITLRALTVDSAINYGSLAPTDNTGAFNPTTTIANTGNVAFDLELLGSDLSDSGSSVIPADQQKFATSTFNYSACATCSLLSSTTPVELSVNLSKPTVSTPPVTTAVYWGISVPLGINSAPHQGINVFTPISP